MNRRKIVVVCGAALLIAAAAVVVLRNRSRVVPLPEVSAVVPFTEVRVKAVERKSELVEQGEAALSSGAVAIVCGADTATADRYEARNDALRSIARLRDLPKDDVEALLVYLHSQDDALRVERVAALKNDVMNLLRNQDPPAEGLVETLITMFEGGSMPPNSSTHNSSTPNSPTHPHPPAVLDYCIQHLGAMVNELDDAARVRVREVFVRAAGDRGKPYAGTALYSLAEDSRATPAQEAQLKRLTLALCRPGVNNVARIAAIQLAGQRGYAEVLPTVRETLSGPRRDAVLDTVCLGSVGLLGNTDDIAILSRFASDSRRAAAADAAIKRIKERADVVDRL